MNAKHTSGRPLKITYVDDRNGVLQKLNKIVGIKDVGNFNLNDIKRDEILKLEVDVKKYFAHLSWMSFRNPTSKKHHISLMKNIYKNMGYKVIQMAKLLMNI